MKAFFNDKRWHAASAQMIRLLLLLGSIVLVGSGVAAAAVTMQAQRDETRSVDLLLLVVPATPSTALIEHSFDLYRRGYGVQIAIAGAGHIRARADLIARGLPAEALLDESHAASLHTTLATLPESATPTILVVSMPTDQLLGLKVTHDAGLRAYGSPVPQVTEETFATLWAVLAYWRYVLFGTV